MRWQRGQTGTPRGPGAVAPEGLTAAPWAYTGVPRGCHRGFRPEARRPTGSQLGVRRAGSG